MFISVDTDVFAASSLALLLFLLTNAVGKHGDRKMLTATCGPRFKLNLHLAD